MNRMKSVAFRLALVPAAAIVLLSPACRLQAQKPHLQPPSTRHRTQKQLPSRTPTDEMDEVCAEAALRRCRRE